MSEKESKDGVKEEKDEENQEIVLKVDMHCEACTRKVARALKGFQGVEEVRADYGDSRVVLKGKEADPGKVSDRIRKKTGRRVEIISPLPKPVGNNEETKDQPEPSKQEKKDEPPAAITVVLNVGMHCEACARALQKRIRKVKGVESVTTDIANDQVIVKGVVDPDKLVKDVHKRTGKQASIVKDEEKKDEEKDEKKEDGKEKDDAKKTDIKKTEYWPPKYYIEYAYPPQIFSDENPNACYVM